MVILLSNSPGPCTNAASNTEKGDSSDEGMSDCELCRRKRRELFILVAAASCGVVKFLWNYCKVTSGHHHVWMDNLHPVPCIYSATYSIHSTFHIYIAKMVKKMLDFRYTGGMNGIIAQQSLNMDNLLVSETNTFCLGFFVVVQIFLESLSYLKETNIPFAIVWL